MAVPTFTHGLFARGLARAVDVDGIDRIVFHVRPLLGAVEDVVGGDVDQRDVRTCAGRGEMRRAVTIHRVGLIGFRLGLSTAVYAAAFTTTSNAPGVITASTALTSVMSNSARSVPTAVTPNFSARRMSSHPTWPLAPVTSILGCSADMGINPYISAGAPNQYRRAANPRRLSPIAAAQCAATRCRCPDRSRGC